MKKGVHEVFIFLLEVSLFYLNLITNTESSNEIYSKDCWVGENLLCDDNRFSHVFKFLILLSSKKSQKRLPLMPFEVLKIVIHKILYKSMMQQMQHKRDIVVHL